MGNSTERVSILLPMDTEKRESGRRANGFDGSTKITSKQIPEHYILSGEQLMILF